MTPFDFNRRASLFEKRITLKAVLDIAINLALVAVLAVRIKRVAVKIMYPQRQPEIILELIINLRREPTLVIIGRAPENFRLEAVIHKVTRELHGKNILYLVSKTIGEGIHGIPPR
jgi:hypothetical protein